MAETMGQAAAVDYHKPGFAVSLLGAALPGLYLLITSTTTLVTSIWPYDFKRMLEFALLLVLFLLVATNRPIREEFGRLLAGTPRLAGIALLGVFGWGVLSAAVNARTGMHLANSLSEVVLLASLVLGVFAVGACRRVSGVAFDRVAVGLLALTGLTVGVQELVGVLAAHSAGVDFTFRISLLHFSWPRFYNQVQSWTVPVIAALPVLFARYPLAKVLCVVAMALQWYVIFVTGARGSFVALSAALLFALAFLPAARGLVLRWQLPAILLGLALYGAVLYSFQSNLPTAASAEPGMASTPSGQASPGFYGNEDAETSGFLAQSAGRPLLDPMGRTGMWRVTLQDARAHPMLGIGPMNYVCTSPAHIGHPHNFPLQLAAEWGIPVAILVCLLAGWLFLCTLLKLRRLQPGASGTSVAALLLTGVLAAGIHALVSGVFVMPASHVAGLVVLGSLTGFAAGGQGRARPEPRGVRTAPIFGISAAIGLLVLGAVELKTLPERASQLRPGEDMRPRIWQNAKVCRLYLDEARVTN